MNMKRHLAVFIVVTGAVLLAGDSLQAAVIFVTDTASDDTVAITPVDFTSFTGDGTFTESTAGLSFSGTFDSTFNGTDVVSFYLLENNNPSVVSDIMNLTTVGDGTSA